MADSHRNYLRDLGDHIRRMGEEARDAVGAASDDERNFQQGRRMAYIEVLSLMQQQAAAFGLPLSDLALDGFDAERDLT
jgi:hypothetical protein